MKILHWKEVITFLLSICRSRGSWDPDYIETFIMSELSKKIAVDFEEYRENNLARNKFRERILECVRYSSFEDSVFLSFLDIHSNNICLSELDQHLLRALFKGTGEGDSVHFLFTFCYGPLLIS